MPTYSAKCGCCGNSTSYFSKISDRNTTPICCDTPMVRLLDTPMIQAQTISGIITCSDGSQHEGHTQFEKYMEKNGLLPSSEANSEAIRVRNKLNDDHAKDVRKTLEATYTQLEQQQ